LFITEILITKDDVERLASIVDQVEKQKNDGIVSIKKRSEYSDTFLIDFLEKSDVTLIISGRTIYRWIENDKIKNFFYKCLINTSKKDESIVKLVIYKNSALVDDEIVKKNELKRELETNVFPKIYNNYNAKNALHLLDQKFQIIEVESLPYIYLSNGKTVIIGPFLLNVNTTCEQYKDNLMIELKPTSSYATSYKNDFNAFIDNTTKATRTDWVKSYIDMKSGRRTL